MVEGSDAIFDVSVVDFIDVIRYNVGDEVTIEYKEGEETNTVLSLKWKTEIQNRDDFIEIPGKWTSGIFSVME